MRLIILVLLLLVLATLITGCGQYTPAECVIAGDNCGGGTKTIIGSPGRDGVDGLPGRDGRDGESIVGPKGDKGESVVGPQGPQGEQGIQGEAGSVGQTGPVGPQGEAGEDGDDAHPSAYTVTELIDPCGDAPNAYDEVLLRMANGTLLSHYADGSRQFLTVIGPGSYVTTDHQACHFTVNQDLTVSY